MARAALEVPEMFLASRTKNCDEVFRVIRLGRVGEKLDALLLSLRLYWTRHGNAAVSTWSELISTQGADLLSAIPLLAHALGSNDQDLQFLYCSLLNCQEELQSTSNALHTYAHFNASIAREVSGHPGCESLVKDKVLLAWCEGMLAERAKAIALTCGLCRFPPFIQALQSLAADPSLPLPTFAGSPVLRLTLAPSQLGGPQSCAASGPVSQHVPPAMQVSVAPALQHLQHPSTLSLARSPANATTYVAQLGQQLVMEHMPQERAGRQQLASLEPSVAEGMTPGSGLQTGQHVIGGAHVEEERAGWQQRGLQPQIAKTRGPGQRLCKTHAERSGGAQAKQDARPVTTAGVLQSGSSEELANALAGLTQMVSTARAMPRPAATADAGRNVVCMSKAAKPRASQAAQHSSSSGEVQDQDMSAPGRVEETSHSRKAKRACLRSDVDRTPGGCVADAHNQADAVRAEILAEGAAAACLRLHVLASANHEPQSATQERMLAAAREAEIVDKGNLSAGGLCARARQLRLILRGDAAPSTSTEKSSPLSNRQSVQGAHVANAVPSPASDSAGQLASFAFAQPDGVPVRGAVEQLTPALPAREAGGRAPERQPTQREGCSAESAVPDSEDATPPDHPGAAAEPSQPPAAMPPTAKSAAGAGNARASHDMPSRESRPGEHQLRGYGDSRCQAGLMHEKPDGAGESGCQSQVCTPLGVQQDASSTPGASPGSAERERLRVLAAGHPAVAVAALLESQRDSNSPNKRKLPVSHRPAAHDVREGECGSGSGSPVSQGPPSNSRGSSGKEGSGVACATGSQRSLPSQPLQVRPTRLCPDGAADAASQHTSSPPGSQLPEQPTADANVAGAERTPCCSRAAAAEEAGRRGMGSGGEEAALRMQPGKRVKWMRAVRALLKMVLQRHTLAQIEGQAGRSNVRLPVSSAASPQEALHRQPFAPAPSSSIEPMNLGTHQDRSCGDGMPPASQQAVAAAAALAQQHCGLSQRDDPGWHSAKFEASGAASQEASQSSSAGHSNMKRMKAIGKRGRDDVANEQESEQQGHLEGASDSKACQLAGTGQTWKRRRTDLLQGAGSSQKGGAAGEEMQLDAGALPAAFEGCGGRQAGRALNQQEHPQGSPSTVEACSDVDVGGPEDLLVRPSAYCNVHPGSLPLTQNPPRDACSHGRMDSAASVSQKCLTHSSEEQDPPCAQPVPPPHLSLGERAEDIGRTPAALPLKTPMQRSSPWATPHFCHPHTAGRGPPDRPSSATPAPATQQGALVAAGDGQNATMRMLSLDSRRSPNWTPGIMCSAVGQHHTAPPNTQASSAPDALHRLARNATQADPTDGLTLHQGSCQPPLLTGPVEGNASGLEEREAALPGTQGLPDEAFAESQMFGGSHSLGRLLYERSQASDEPPPLSQTGPPIPSPSQ